MDVSSAEKLSDKPGPGNKGYVGFRQASNDSAALRTTRTRYAGGVTVKC